MSRIEDIGAFNTVREAGLAKLLPNAPRVAVGMGTCGRGNGGEAVYQALGSAIERDGMDIRLVPTGCFGACSQEAMVNVWIPGRPLVMLRHVQASDADRILAAINQGTVPPDLAWCRIDEWDHLTAHIRYGSGFPELPLWSEIPFFNGQKRIVLRNCGLISPDDIDEYIAVGGYQALYKVLIDGKPEAVIEQIKAAKLRGRGGAGYATGLKWEFLSKAPDTPKYIICNADEGDPGAYMNRNEIESDPHSLLEGMIIAGYVTGASQGIVYVRAEYPLAVQRLIRAIEQARDYGVLGANILGRPFHFDIQMVEGAGAFVCGEETALIASLEGFAGRPRPRPPFPASKGLFGKPTNINNVETWYNVAPIVLKGPAWFTETGSTKSAGTKVFSLVGKIANTGLVEMPLGTPLARFVYDVGGGALKDGAIKAVQTGGPSGGCIPHEMFDTPVDYETLAQLGSIMGSGGMVVMDEDNCMVDIARYFIEFTHSESCGKCVPCRVGLDQALTMLNGLTKGTGTLPQLDLLDELSRMIRDTSLCGLGQSAPNPVLTSMRHFRHEFEDHIIAKRCRAGVCNSLALSPCENSCPLHMNIPRFLDLLREGRHRGRVRIGDSGQSAARFHRPRLPASLRQSLPPADSGCAREHARGTPLHCGHGAALGRFRSHRGTLCGAPDGPHRQALRRGRRRSGGTHVRLLPGAAGTRGGGLRKPTRSRRHAALCDSGIPPAQTHARARGGPDRAAGRRSSTSASAVGSTITLNELDEQFDAVFLSIGTWKESWVYLAGTELKGVLPRPAVPGEDRLRRNSARPAAAWR